MSEVGPTSPQGSLNSCAWQIAFIRRSAGREEVKCWHATWRVGIASSHKPKIERRLGGAFGGADGRRPQLGDEILGKCGTGRSDGLWQRGVCEPRQSAAADVRGAGGSIEKTSQQRGTPLYGRTRTRTQWRPSRRGCR